MIEVYLNKETHIRYGRDDLRTDLPSKCIVTGKIYTIFTDSFLIHVRKTILIGTIE